MDATPGALLDDVHAVAGDRIDERTMHLAFLGELVSGAGARGWAWNSLNHADPTTRKRDRNELDWWIDRARGVGARMVADVTTDAGWSSNT